MKGAFFLFLLGIVNFSVYGLSPSLDPPSVSPPSKSFKIVQSPSLTEETLLKGRLLGLEGKAEIRRPKSIIWEKAQVGQEVYSGFQIRTFEGARLKIEVGSNIIYLKGKSKFIFSESSINRLTHKYRSVFECPYGRAKFHIKDTKNLLEFKVKTPTAVAGARGTIFYLIVEPHFTQVIVEEGLIILKNLISGRTQEVREGFMSESKKDGTVSKPQEVPEELKEEFSSQEWEPKEETEKDEEEKEDINQETKEAKETQEENIEEAQEDKETSQDAEKPQFSEVDFDGDGVLDDKDIDDDNDGLSDSWEARAGTDPKNADTDGDSLSDYMELAILGDPLKADTDGDGLSDGFELKHLMSPEDTDSDDDGYPDNVEISSGTSPTSSFSFPSGLTHNKDLDEETDNYDDDSDGDRIPDVVEQAVGLNPYKVDSDNDGISDYDEISREYNLLAGVDSDGDGLTDDFENAWGRSEYILFDSDGDGLSDLEEMRKGTNPKAKDTDGDSLNDNVDPDPLLQDADHDGVRDDVEVSAGTDPNYPTDFPDKGIKGSAYDYDGDGVPDASDWDDDNDGLEDDVETESIGSDPKNPDTDGDGITDGREYNLGFDPLVPNSAPLPKGAVDTTLDSDGDGLSDYYEHFLGTDIRTKRYEEIDAVSDLRTEIADMLTDNFARRRDYLIDKISDAQAHKVLTDKNGYRVRVEEYVLRPSPKKIMLLNICLRTDNSSPLDGLTVLNWTTEFNTSLNNLTSSQIRGLPWDKYLSEAPDYGATQPNYYPVKMSVKLKDPSNNYLKEERTYSALFQAGQTYRQNTTSQIDLNGAYEGFEAFAVTGVSSGNPGHFTYQAQDSGGAVVFNIYVINEKGALVGGSYSFSSLWDVLGANLGSSASGNYVGDNFIEISAGIDVDGGGPDFYIDSVYIPLSNLRWKDKFSWKDASP